MELFSINEPYDLVFSARSISLKSKGLPMFRRFSITNGKVIVMIFILKDFEALQIFQNSSRKTNTYQMDI